AINGGSFNNNTFGIYTNANSGSSSNQNAFNNITVTGTTFTGNGNKGLYFEKLNNALFTGIVLTNNGISGGFASGMDVNLKYGTYTNLSITNSTFTGNGTGDPTNGSGLTIKGRNDAPTYSGNPASLSTVSLNNITIDGSP